MQLKPRKERYHALKPFVVRRKIHSPAYRTLVVILGAAVWFYSHNLAAATNSVSNLNDSGQGSLRSLIATSAAGDTIIVPVAGTITLTTGELLITHDLKILGPGADNCSVSGQNSNRVFDVTSGNVWIAGLTLRDGVNIGITNGANGAGGGVFNSANLMLSNCAIFKNLAAGSNGADGASGLSAKSGRAGGQGIGGGIYNGGRLRLVDCTLWQNEARGGRGAMVEAAGRLAQAEAREE
jgi:hypothetical protein